MKDSINQELAIGDFVSFLAPSKRELNIGLITGFAPKSARIWKVNFQDASNRWNHDEELTRMPDITVKIVTPIDLLMSNANSTFCVGVRGKASGWSIDQTIQNSRNWLDPIRGRNSYLGDPQLIEEKVMEGVIIGWNWYEHRLKS